MELPPTSFRAKQEYHPDTLASPTNKVLTVYAETMMQVLLIIQSMQNGIDNKCSIDEIIQLCHPVCFICWVLITISAFGT